MIVRNWLDFIKEKLDNIKGFSVLDGPIMVVVNDGHGEGIIDLREIYNLLSSLEELYKSVNDGFIVLSTTSLDEVSFYSGFNDLMELRKILKENTIFLNCLSSNCRRLYD